MAALVEVTMRFSKFGVSLGEWAIDENLASRSGDAPPCLTLKFYEYMGPDKFNLAGREISIPLEVLLEETLLSAFAKAKIGGDGDEQ